MCSGRRKSCGLFRTNDFRRLAGLQAELYRKNSMAQQSGVVPCCLLSIVDAWHSIQYNRAENLESTLLYSACDNQNNPFSVSKQQNREVLYFLNGCV